MPRAEVEPRSEMKITYSHKVKISSLGCECVINVQRWDSNT